MDTASGSYRLSLLYRLDDACNYTENFNSVLLWPCSLGNFPPLMILGSWNETCEFFFSLLASIKSFVDNY